MEAEKRKLAGNDVVFWRKKHKKAPAVNEDEVEDEYIWNWNIILSLLLLKCKENALETQISLARRCYS
ncbi:hypothetical protein ACLB2K_042716 [Fragaria x ananassa]